MNGQILREKMACENKMEAVTDILRLLLLSILLAFHLARFVLAGPLSPSPSFAVPQT